MKIIFEIISPFYEFSKNILIFSNKYRVQFMTFFMTFMTSWSVRLPVDTVFDLFRVFFASIDMLKNKKLPIQGDPWVVRCPQYFTKR